MVRPLMGTCGEVAGLGADGNDDAAAIERHIGVGPLDADAFRVDEMRHAVDYVNAIARQLSFSDVDLGLDHTLDPEGQVSHADFFLDAVIHAIHVPVVVAGEMQYGFAHRLGWNGSGVDADAADNGPRLHDGNFLLELGGGYRGALPGGSGTNYDQVIFSAHAFFSQQCEDRGARWRSAPQ